jgi:3,4-dihydroxy-9,10-secoandrosta-1,3,5(10)-triene-9,17-dione 4,5-dioxygenase
MVGVTQLGYLGIGARDVEGWRGYAERLLGLEVAATDADGTTLLRMDERHHRFALHEDGADDVVYAGWQVDDAAAVDEIAGRLEAAGVVVARGSAEEAERRRVGGLIKFADPDGNACEVFHDAEQASREFRSARDDTAFVAGDQGLGHVVFMTPDLKRAMSFYTSMLGMRESDYVNTEGARLGFLHCNPRHHSLAFVQPHQAPPVFGKRTNHFMLQLQSIDPVGRAYDAVTEGAAPLLVTMGRHPNDEMVSFYMANPSSFGVEYGWGAREVDDSCWEVQEYDTPSLWGHKRPRPQT